MKLLITKTLIFVTAITLAFSANAQNDYVITVKGDSIPCEITTPLVVVGANLPPYGSHNMPSTVGTNMPLFGTGKYKYKSATMSESKKISPDEIKEIYTAEDQNLYRAVFVDDDKKPTYLTVIEKGKISLYERIFTVYNGTTTTTTTSWYVGKGTDNVQWFKGTGLNLGKPRGERKRDFAEMVKDDKNVYDKFIADDKFGFDDIRNIVHLYNTGEQYNKDLGIVNLSGVDYIITQKNDTVRCRIKNDFFKGYFTFREHSKDDFTKIDSSYINEYYYSRENTTFKLVTLPDQNKKEFVKLLEKGRINLYELTAKTTEGKKTIVKYNWYVSKGAGSLIQIKKNAKPGADIRSNKDLYKAFINIISDNKELLERFNEIFRLTSYNTDEVVENCIDNYNSLYIAAQYTGK